MQDQEVIREFLVESHENLSRLDQELVELEQRPKDGPLLASVFRTIHTIKGTCGFLGFTTLEGITHQAENLLSQLRDGQRELGPSLVSLILETVDATRVVLASIEASGEEGTDRFEALIERLRIATSSAGTPEPAPSVALPRPSGAAPAAGQRSCQSDSTPAAPAAESAGNPPPCDPDSPAEKTEAGRSDEDSAKSSAVADSNIRVGVGLLDKLMDLVGELVLTRNQILQFNAEREDAALSATSQRLNLITSELQEGVMKTRMQPIGMVWNKLPRVVRDMAVALGKQIRLEMDGAETELDRTIIEAIKDPLVHLVRNSCDHGIEPPETRLQAGKQQQGRLSLRAYHEGGQVNIEIGDDGAGIDVERVKRKAIERGILRPETAEKMTDREALNLIFLPGFSMARKITNVSGRGVGMDVVKSHIEKIGGVVDIASRPGAGVTVRIKIPLTLAIIPGLVIASGGERFVIPQVSLLELIRLEGDNQDKRIEYVHGTPVYRRRGSLLPITRLNRVLGLDDTAPGDAVSMVVLQAEDRQFGLVVDGISDTQEIVVKPLCKQLKGLSVYAGATIMGDGRVALILDVLGIGQRSGVLAESRDTARAKRDRAANSQTEQQRLLLFRAGSFERLAVPLSLVARLEEFPSSAVEHASGGIVVQYRNRILPLVVLREILEPDVPRRAIPPGPVQVVVFNDGEHSAGIVVDQILDVVEEEVAIRQKSGRRGLLGSAVIGKKVTDFLDLTYVIHASAVNWFDGAGEQASGRRILLADGSAFSRSLIRGELEMAGYKVVEACGLPEALRALEQQRIDLIAVALNLPSEGAAELLAAMKRRPDWEGIPVLGLAGSPDEVRRSDPEATGLMDCQSKYDRAAMLESLSRLSAALARDSTSAVCTGGEW